MERCWATEGDTRPPFASAAALLGDMAENGRSHPPMYTCMSISTYELVIHSMRTIDYTRHCGSVHTRSRTHTHTHTHIHTHTPAHTYARTRVYTPTCTSCICTHTLPLSTSPSLSLLLQITQYFMTFNLHARERLPQSSLT